MVLVTLLFGAGCDTSQRHPELTVAFDSRAPLEGEYKITETGSGFHCDFKTDAFSSGFELETQIYSVDELFRVFATAVKNTPDVKTELEYSVKIRYVNGSVVRQLKRNLDAAVDLFGRERLLAELHEEIMRRAGVPKRYWYYSIRSGGATIDH